MTMSEYYTHAEWSDERLTDRMGDITSKLRSFQHSDERAQGMLGEVLCIYFEQRYRLGEFTPQPTDLQSTPET